MTFAICKVLYKVFAICKRKIQFEMNKQVLANINNQPKRRLQVCRAIYRGLQFANVKTVQNAKIYT